MPLLTDSEITEHLDSLKIPHGEEPYIRIQNNNYAITDGKYFFMKTSESKESLMLELETTLRLPSAPKLYVPELSEIGTTLVLITHYIPHEESTPDNLTLSNIENLLDQMYDINTLQAGGYPSLRKLEAVLNLLGKRMQNPILKEEEIKLLNKLLEAFVYPYVENNKNSATLAHSDVKLPNILKKNNEEVVLIDYESIKPSPPEMDLASLYQDLYQAGAKDTYSRIESAYISRNGKVNRELLNSSILFKNVLTTTAAFQLDDRGVRESRLVELEKSLKSQLPPETLEPVELNKNEMPKL